MNARSPIPIKAKRLIPVLGSSHDAEALSACRAISRVLNSAGLTFHDMADAIDTSPTGEVVTDAISFGPVPPYRPSRRKVWAFTPKQTAHHREMALWCRNNDRGRLRPRERAFINNVVAWRRELTILQADWLTDITDRLEQECRGWAAGGAR